MHPGLGAPIGALGGVLLRSDFPACLYSAVSGRLERRLTARASEPASRDQQVADAFAEAPAVRLACPLAPLGFAYFFSSETSQLCATAAYCSWEAVTRIHNSQAQ
jgi:hypothetical protein